MSANPYNGLDLSSPSKYFDFPVLSLGSMATVTLKRASLVKPPGLLEANTKRATTEGQNIQST